jgi:predicted dehydrogenase
MIGVGWWGMINARAAFKAGGVEVLAICDIDSEHLEKSAEEIEKLQGTRPKTFKLYAELLETPGMEAVIISTPPQWHALPFLAALSKGMHIYMEKPVSYDVREGRAMVEAAAKRPHQVVQIGFSASAKRGLQGGQAVHCGRQSRQGGAGRGADQREGGTEGSHAHRASAQPRLESLVWPGPLIPYSQQVGHVSWRLEETSGQGHLYDWGIHMIDARESDP